MYYNSDNPRTEEPEAIIKDILEGIDKKNYHVVVDREQAIAEAISMAKGWCCNYNR